MSVTLDVRVLVDVGVGLLDPVRERVPVTVTVLVLVKLFVFVGVGDRVGVGLLDAV